MNHSLSHVCDLDTPSSMHQRLLVHKALEELSCGGEYQL